MLYCVEDWLEVRERGGEGGRDGLVGKRGCA